MKKAHQWFGNLVTMEWWTDLWLNEGFATWVGNLAVDHLFPEWEIWTNFVTGLLSTFLSLFFLSLLSLSLFSLFSFFFSLFFLSLLSLFFLSFLSSFSFFFLSFLSLSFLSLSLFLSLPLSLKEKMNSNCTKKDYVARAMKMDALKNSHPIEVEVTDSGSINEIFDAISYCKGASIIRMLADYVGEKAFKEGLHNYLTAFQYKNAKTEDLWKHLSSSSNKPIHEIMSQWTKVKGFPVLKVEKKGASELEYTQTVFLSSGEEEKDSPVWPIPLSISTDSHSSLLVEVLKEGKGVVECPQAENSKWLKVNSLQSSFVRVEYSPHLLSLLSLPVKQLQLPAVDRLGLQNDLFALSQAGRVSASKALEFSLNYINETEYAVWSDLLSNLSSLSSIWSSEPNSSHFKNFRCHLLQNIFSSLGWEGKQGESSTNPLLRATVISVLGSSDDKKVVEEAKKRFAHFLKDNSSLSPDLRGTVWRTVVSNGGKQEFEQVLQIFQNATENSEKVKALSCLGSTPDEELIKKTLSMSIDTNVVRSQDSIYAISGCASNPKGTLITWEWFKQNWEKIEKLFGEGNFLMSGIISSVTKNFTDANKAKEIEHFFSDKKVATAKRTIQQSIETIHSNSAWLQRDRESVAQFLKQFEHSNL